MQNPESQRKRVCLTVWSASAKINKNWNKITSSMMIKRVFGNFENIFSQNSMASVSRLKALTSGTKCILLFFFCQKRSNREGMVAHREARRGKVFARERMGSSEARGNQVPPKKEWKASLQTAVLHAGCTRSPRAHTWCRRPSLTHQCNQMLWGLQPRLWDVFMRMGVGDRGPGVKNHSSRQILGSLDQWEQMKFETF